MTKRAALLPECRVTAQRLVGAKGKRLADEGSGRCNGRMPISVQ
jgi:hypothetical protein